MERQQRFLLLLGVLLVVYLSGVATRTWLGTRVVISNRSGASLQSVSVKVLGTNTEHDHPLANVAPDGHKRAFVEPLSGARLNLQFADSQGTVRSVTVFGHTGASRCLTVEVEVLPGTAINTRQVQGIGCWNSWFGLL